MVSARIYLEGGGDSKDGKTRCREGFHKLLQKCGLTGRMPRLIASGGRNNAFDSFKTAHSNSPRTEYVALMIDSEDPVSNIEETWNHLRERDGWSRPQGAKDDQVLFMTTCMETWIVADRRTLEEHFGQSLQVNALPAPVNLEDRGRRDVQGSLENATRRSPGPYSKGPKSFAVLGKLDPDTSGSPPSQFQESS